MNHIIEDTYEEIYDVPTDFEIVESYVRHAGDADLVNFTINIKCKGNREDAISYALGRIKCGRFHTNKHDKMGYVQI